MGAGLVFAISKIGKKFLERLQKKPFRHAYLAERIRRGIAYQIRALRDQRKWKQGTFAKHLGKPQSVVCRLEDPDYGKVTVQTLLEVANVFDVALEIKFVSYSSFICNSRDVSITSLQVPEFKDDLGLAEAKVAPIKIDPVILTERPPVEAKWREITDPKNFTWVSLIPTSRQPGGKVSYVH